jgi:hypothetical protein
METKPGGKLAALIFVAAEAEQRGIRADPRLPAD